MSKPFDPSRLYSRLPYGTTVPSFCPRMPQISFDCRVDGAWLERNLADTPFTPVGDRVMISAADFSNNQAVPFHDVMVLAPVEYKGMRGSHPIIEFENLNRTVMGGREKWGYPKLYADISFDRTDTGGVEVAVRIGGRSIMQMSWAPDPSASESVEPLKLWPHYLLRLLPSASEPGMGFAEVLTRDTSEDLKLLETHAGRGTLTFSPWPEHEIDYCDLAGVPIREILSAKLTIADWYATEKNGWARLVDRLL